MFSVQQIKAITFAVVNHYKGWQLLRNPEGVSGTTVKMIKGKSKIDKRTLDTTVLTSRITADFSDKKAGIKREYLESIRFNFYNDNNEKIDSKKQLLYKKIAPKFYIPEIRQKSSVSARTLQERQLNSLHVNNINRIEYYSIPAYNQLENINLNSSTFPILVNRSFAHIEVEKFNRAKADHSSGLPFWRTLLDNLKQA